jgi:hypothetical protein
MTLRRLALGATVGADDFKAALTCRQELTEAMDHLLDHFDAVISPPVLQSAPAVPHSLQDFPSSPSRAMAFNVTGHPAMSVPVGLSRDRLPLALQVAARAFDEATMFAIGHAIETITGWRNVIPSARRVFGRARQDRNAIWGHIPTRSPIFWSLAACVTSIPAPTLKWLRTGAGIWGGRAGISAF